VKGGKKLKKNSKGKKSTAKSGILNSKRQQKIQQRRGEGGEMVEERKPPLQLGAGKQKKNSKNWVVRREVKNTARVKTWKKREHAKGREGWNKFPQKGLNGFYSFLTEKESERR